MQFFPHSLKVEQIQHILISDVQITVYMDHEPGININMPCLMQHCFVNSCIFHALKMENVFGLIQEYYMSTSQISKVFDEKYAKLPPGLLMTREHNLKVKGFKTLKSRLNI